MRRGALLACGVLVAPACALHAPPLPALPRHAAVSLSVGVPPGVASLPRHRARLVLPSMHVAAEEFVSDPDAARSGRGARLRKKLRQLVLCVLLTTSLRLSPARATTAGALDAPSAPAVSVKAPASAQRMAMDGCRNPWARLRLRRRPATEGGEGGARTCAAPGRKSAATLVAAAPAKTRPSLSGTVSSVVQAAKDVSAHVDAAERDTIVVLGVSALVPPVMNMLNLSPVLGFLFAGIVIGPSGLGLVRSSPDCPAPELTNLSQLHRPRCEPA